MQDTFSQALGFLEESFAKKGETVTERFFDFFGTDKEGSAFGFKRTMPSW